MLIYKAGAFKPTIPEVEPLVKELYERHSAGCCLHLVLDDDNIEDDNVLHCIKTAVINKHEKCLELANLLLQMSKTQRRKLCELVGKL